MGKKKKKIWTSNPKEIYFSFYYRFPPVMEKVVARISEGSLTVKYFSGTRLNLPVCKIQQVQLLLI